MIMTPFTYEIFTNRFLFYIPQVKLSFLIKIVALKVREMKLHFCLPLELKTMHNSKFLLYSKYPSWFSPQYDIFIYYIAEMFQKF